MAEDDPVVFTAEVGCPPRGGPARLQGDEGRGSLTSR